MLFSNEDCKLIMSLRAQEKSVEDAVRSPQATNGAAPALLPAFPFPPFPDKSKCRL